MKPEVLTPNELVSALVDGELRADAFAQAIEVLAVNEEARANWHSYHVLGEVLRSGDLAASGAGDVLFVQRLRERLQSETTARMPDMIPTNPALAKQTSANDANLRWKWVASFAVLSTVTVLAWQLAGDALTPPAAPQLVQAPVAPSLEAAQVMVRDPQLDQLLAAHQQLGGTSALQMPSGFLRNATFDRPGR